MTPTLRCSPPSSKKGCWVGSFCRWWRLRFPLCDVDVLPMCCWYCCFGAVALVSVDGKDKVWFYTKVWDSHRRSHPRSHSTEKKETEIFVFYFVCESQTKPSLHGDFFKFFGAIFFVKLNPFLCSQWVVVQRGRNIAGALTRNRQRCVGFC